MKNTLKAPWMSLSFAVLAACGAPKNGSGDGGNGTQVTCTLPAIISANMTLTTACPAWRVTASGTSVAGTGNPVLTIEPGVTVAFDKGGFLSIGTGATNGTSEPGGLVAVGTPDAGITFTSGAAIPAAGDWSAVALADDALATSTLAYATFEFGSGVGSGGNTSSADGYSYPEPAGALIVYGGTNSASLVLHDLTFSHNQGNGLVYDNFNGGFGAGSGNLHVEDWGTGYAPFVISANQASTLPATLVAPGGVVDLIKGQGGPAGTGGAALVGVTQTWPAIPVPYLVDGDIVGRGGGVQVEGAGNSTATLTIAAPNTLEFKSGGLVEVDPNGSGQGGLVATGTPTSDLTFTSNAASPTPGAWGGIKFNAPSAGGSALASSKLQGITVEWAGDGTIGMGGVSAAAIGIFASTAGSAGPSISGCTLRGYPSAACGIVYDKNFVVPPASYDTPANSFSGGSCTVDDAP